MAWSYRVPPVSSDLATFIRDNITQMKALENEVGQLGAQEFGVRTVEASGRFLASDSLVVVDATSGAVTMTLPLGAGIRRGRTLGVKKKDASVNAVTLDGNGADIDGAGTKSTTTQHVTIWVRWDGTDWWVI